MDKNTTKRPRVQITLSQSDFDDLKELSEALDESMSKLASQMIHHGIKTSSAQVKAFNDSVASGDNALTMVSKLFKSALKSLDNVIDEESGEVEVKKKKKK